MTTILTGFVLICIVNVTWSKARCFSLDLDTITSYPDDIDCFEYHIESTVHECNFSHIHNNLGECGNEFHCGFSRKQSPATCRYPDKPESCDNIELHDYNEIIIGLNNTNCPSLYVEYVQNLLHRDSTCDPMVEMNENGDIGIKLNFKGNKFDFQLCFNGIKEINTGIVEFNHLRRHHVRINEKCLYEYLPDLCETFDPVSAPTTSPIIQQCQLHGREIDVVILNDVDGSYEDEYGNSKVIECEKQQNMVAQTLTAIKGAYYDNGDLPLSRVAYIEFDKDRADVVIALNANPYNGNNDGPDSSSSMVTDSQMRDYYNLIAKGCVGLTDSKLISQKCDDNNPTKLYDALIEAQKQFNLQPTGSDKGRDRYIVIFSNCQLPQFVREQICRDFEEYIKTGMINPGRNANLAGKGINVVMINIGNQFNDNIDDYILCLTEYDENRIYQTSLRNENEFYMNGLQTTIVAEICNSPTPSPTIDPTIDPTKIPTKSPINNPCSQIIDGTMKLDAIFVVDKSCVSTHDINYCSIRQYMIAELMTKIKGDDIRINENIASRVAYIESGAEHDDVMIHVNLNNYEYNQGPIYRDDIIEYYQNIRDKSCGLTQTPSGQTDLASALEVAIRKLTDDGRGDAVKKIIVFSECENTPSIQINDICETGPDSLKHRITDKTNGIDVIFINLGSQISSQYGECLTNSNDISHYPLYPNLPPTQVIVDDISMNICKPPTSSPTTEPTTKPTDSPIHVSCEIGYDLDVVFLVDQSCGMSPPICREYMDGIFEYIASIKRYSQPRVAYIDMISQNVDPFISLNNKDYNDLNDIRKFSITIDSMQHKIRNQDCNKGEYERANIIVSINKAMKEFNDYSTTDRHKKMNRSRLYL